METSCPLSLPRNNIIFILSGKKKYEVRRTWRRSSGHLVLLCFCISLILSMNLCSSLQETVNNTLRRGQHLPPNSTLSTSFSSPESFECLESDEILIGYLTDISGPTNTKRQGLVISGAISYAVEQINKKSAQDYNFLRGKRLKLLYEDTSGDTINGTRKLLKLWNQGVVAFFGPEDSCETEAKVAASVNLPMISYKCADSRVSDKKHYPTFARTFPPDTQVIHSILSLLNYYEWKKFTLIYESSPPYESVALSLLKAVKTKNFTVNSERSYANFYLCCEKSSECCMNPFVSIVNTTYEGTRVYIFVGRESDLIKFMLILRTRGILDHGEYVVIFVDLESYVKDQSYKYLYGPLMTSADARASTEAARSLLVIVPSPPASSNYSDFEERVREYNSQPPFHFPSNVTVMDRYRKKFITIYASYLYDSVTLYANALSSLFNQPRNKTFDKNQSRYCLNDGRRIINEIINSSYTSITGAGMSIDSNGDAQGNYTVLSLQPTPPDLEFRGLKNHRPSHVMLPVGFFGYEGNSSETKFKLTGKMNWVAKEPPLDEPPCGYDGSACRPPEDNKREILAGILIGTFMTASLIAAVVYRNWKYEQEIAGLLWRISIKDLYMHQTSGGIDSGLLNLLAGSRQSLGSAASNELCAGGQIFTSTGKYKGSVVAVKSLKFSNTRRVEVPREVKKEMKLMKEIHHDNINPFIGAYIEPNSVLIVTEYCSKGSLHDILENDDLRLDSMFVASLVFDLIHGMIYLHDSLIKVHGNLKSHNCLITSRFVLQVSDFGLLRLRKTCDLDSENIDSDRRLLWQAPELLRDPNLLGTQKGDVYAFALILHEILARNGPFGIDDGDAEEYDSQDDKNDGQEEDNGDDNSNISTPGSRVLNIAENCLENKGENRQETGTNNEVSADKVSTDKEAFVRSEGKRNIIHDREGNGDHEGSSLRFCDREDDKSRENSCRGDDDEVGRGGEMMMLQSNVRDETQVRCMTSNVISTGVALKEIKWARRKLTAKDIISLVIEVRDEPFRPDISGIEVQDFVLNTMKDSWHEIPDRRPDFRVIKGRLKKMRQGLKSNFVDNMIFMMEKYQNNLEELVDNRTLQLIEEKKKTEHLLHQMLPKSVAADLMKGKMVTPETFESVTIFFSDIVGFTAMCSESTPMQVVNFLHDLYQLFDDIISNYDVYKVETIGDAYMVVSGLPISNGDAHATEIASMAIELLENVKNFKIRHRPNDTLQLRIGIHTGAVVAGVVGKTMPRYCLFGDTVNTASRYESNGEALKIHISPQLRQHLVKYDTYLIEERGSVRMKGKGEVMTYWLIGHKNPEGMSRRKDLPIFELFSAVTTTKVPLSRRGSIVTFRGVNETLTTSSSQVNLSSNFAQRLQQQRFSNTSPSSPWASSPRITRKMLKTKTHSREPSLEGISFSRAGNKLLPLPSRRSQTSLSMYPSTTTGATNNSDSLSAFTSDSTASSSSGLTANRMMLPNSKELPPKIPHRKLTTVLSEDEEEETRAGLDISVSLLSPPNLRHSRTRDRKTSNRHFMKSSVVNARTDIDKKKSASMNEVGSDGEPSIPRISSLSIFPNHHDYTPLPETKPDKEFEVKIDCPVASNSRTLVAAKQHKHLHLLSWFTGFGRKTSSDPNLDQNVNQKLIQSTFPVKESVIETNV